MALCRICDSRPETFLDLGKMPLGNGFLEESGFDREYFYELAVMFCPGCKMVQLVQQPEAERMFHDHYPFFSSSSTRMANHFRAAAEDIMAKSCRNPDPLVVEIGSNDGILLQHLSAAGRRHVGIEPCSNVAAAAREKGVKTVCEFFTPDLARRLVCEEGQADVVFAANVMCHIPDLHSIVKGIDILLGPAGVFVFEDPYLGRIVEQTAYDQMYDEHVFYFSVMAVKALFEMHEMDVVDAEVLTVHGGSMRYTIARKGTVEPSFRVARQIDEEENTGLHGLKALAEFRWRVEESRNRLRDLLEGIVSKGARVVGYGATSKSTTSINYCGLTSELLEYISDTTPEKQGKFSPGAHIPVCSHERFAADSPDYALLLAWNHAKEIFAKETGFRDRGGRWIVYVPEVEVIR